MWAVISCLILGLSSPFAQAMCDSLEPTPKPVRRTAVEKDQPTTLDPKVLQTGDVLAFSRLAAVTPFIVQSLNGTPLDHVVLVVVEKDGTRRFYDFVNPTETQKAAGSKGSLRKMSFEELMSKTQSSPAWLIGRTQKPLTPGEGEILARVTDEYFTGARQPMPQSCTVYIRSAYAAIQRTVGYEEQNTNDKGRDWFGGLAKKVWGRQTNTENVVPLTSLFQGEMHVFDYHLWHQPAHDPLFWDVNTMWETWLAKGNMKMIADKAFEWRGQGTDLDNKTKLALFIAEMSKTVPERK